MLLWCDALSTLYTIPVQVEGYGSAINVSESTIHVANSGLSMTVRCNRLELSERNSKTIQEMARPLVSELQKCYEIPRAWVCLRMPSVGAICV